ncbi:MAG TPA: hypothetical protein VH442_07675, partial [Micromonosporaceae bacterium]
IIVPTGWRLGVLRIEDVALGCAASLVAGALFWPRGAGASLGIAIGESYRESARYLRESVDYVAGHRGMQPDKHGAVLDAGYRLDDAFRQYLAERGAKRVDLEDVAALTNGASRLRLAGEAVASLRRAFPDTAPEVRDAALEGPIQALKTRTTQVASWYSALGNVISGESTDLPALEPDVREPSFLDVVLPAVDRCGDPDRAARAERLLWSGQYVGDVSQIRSGLLPPAEKVRATLRTPWWRP